ncbi:MAG: hypothetical protein WC196_05065 [Bacilli bacterium]|jgi:hypothetical protein
MQNTLIDSALRNLAEGLQNSIDKATEKPSEWIQKYFYVPDPRDPITGKFIGRPGPIMLTDHQAAIVDEALSKKPDGTLKYTNVVYSAPKKSGKSAITSAVMMYVAINNPNSFLACLANDGKQANDRLYGPIYTCLRLHRQLGGIFKNESPNLGHVILNNNTKIEAIPVDAAGEAGSQPLFVAFSELWGYETPNKRKVFTEMTIPPTLYGRAMRWVESYAGYSGVSELLEQLYNTGFVKGVPHPDFLHLQGKDGPVVRVNERASMFVYWDTEHRMPWQTSDYYQVEAEILPATEFDRIHNNMWVSPLDSFIREEWWDACENGELPVLESSTTPVVVGIDMAETGDCAALVAVTRDPFEPETKIAVRAVKIFNPRRLGGVIDQELDVRPVLEDWSSRWNIVCFVYDPREMSKMAQDLTRSGMGWFKKFGQTQPRAVADKALYDRVVSRQLSWNRDTTVGDVGFAGDNLQDTLRKHITLAGANTSGESRRLIKLSNSNKIDAAVALSQAAHVIMELAVGNDELNVEKLIRQYQRHEITEEEFTKRVRRSNPKLTERLSNGAYRRKAI